MSVRYKRVRGYRHYRVGTDGLIRRLHADGWHRLGCHTRKDNGYVSVTLYKDGQHSQRLVHRVVLEAFRGPCPEGRQGRHLNGVRTDNSLKNLRWSTPKANNADRRKHGTLPFGSKCSWAKLSEKKVRAVRVLLAMGVSVVVIARLFGVTPPAIRDVRKGKTWRHVSEAVAAECTQVVLVGR